MMRLLGRRLLVAAAFSTLVAGTASAQLTNRPFSFNNGQPGVGMSIGGRQAILNERFTGATPRVLLRDGTGELVDVRRAAPGHAAIVSRPGGNFLPGFRRTDWTGGNASISVGAFNAFFVPSRDRSGAYLAVQATSGDVVNTWTTRVVSGAQGAIFRYDSTVDVWTAQVGGLPPMP